MKWNFLFFVFALLNNKKKHIFYSNFEMSFNIYHRLHERISNEREKHNINCDRLQTSKRHIEWCVHIDFYLLLIFIDWLNIEYALKISYIFHAGTSFQWYDNKRRKIYVDKHLHFKVYTEFNEMNVGKFFILFIRDVITVVTFTKKKKIE